MDQYHRQAVETRALQQEYNQKTAEEKKEWEDRRYHLKEMMATEGWLITTRILKLLVEGAQETVDTAIDLYRIHRSQGAIELYKRFYMELQRLTTKLEEGEENGN